MRIACPKCEWEPTATDLWCCAPGCGNVWNTFETMGRCLQCGKVWRETCCHRCEEWSPHFDWYHDLPEVAIEEETSETVRDRVAGEVALTVLPHHPDFCYCFSPLFNGQSSRLDAGESDVQCGTATDLPG